MIVLDALNVNVYTLNFIYCPIHSTYFINNFGNNFNFVLFSLKTHTKVLCWSFINYRWCWCRRGR